MAHRPKQIWPGAAMQRFFAAVLARETNLPAHERENLAKALSRPIGRLLVYHDPADLPSTQPDNASTGEGVATPALSPGPPPFDPYAFSAVAVLKRGGVPALLERLAGISEAEHLRSLAAAQHLALDYTGDETVPLRQAIITGAEARLKERRAAAS